MKIAQTTDEIWDNPTDFGIPTIEEFKKNRERWVGREDDALSSVSKGGAIANGFTQKHIYEIEGYRCKTLEEVERIAAQQGVPLRSLDYRAILVPQGAGKGDLLIKFVSKDERIRRDGTGRTS